MTHWMPHSGAQNRQDEHEPISLEASWTLTLFGSGSASSYSIGVQNSAFPLILNTPKPLIFHMVPNIEALLYGRLMIRGWGVLNPRRRDCPYHVEVYSRYLILLNIGAWDHSKGDCGGPRGMSDEPRGSRYLVIEKSGPKMP